MRLLVIEDEEKVANSLQRGLKAEGYVVDVAYDSDQALVLTGATDYDLILIDWMIPGKHDGPALIKLWRTEHSLTPFLMLTAKGSIGDKVSGLDAGADDYLAKPFSFDELLARVRALLRRPKGHSGNVIIIDKIKLDLVGKGLWLDDKEIHVTAKEFQLLEYLMRHRGEVLSKERLLSHVWSDEARVQHNTVETFIAHLRKKLGEQGDIIKTIRGYGYCIK
ncbi:MAG TPA: response regulator transcription factor [Candidatus Saccharimonadales bacterium]|nr:response regulator transcription factor [Candidatus Saccharimonadales bacterium]